MSSFSLKKWYLDAADDKGHLYIGYWIRLQWKSTTLHGYQHLWHTPQNGIQSSGTFGKWPQPECENNQVNWNSDQVQGTWTSQTADIGKVLLSTNQGSIHWHCIQPKAEATISLPDVAIHGWGYVECIDITIPIWRLPFKILYWGRCHTQTHYLTWIRWEVTTEQNLLWHNGQCYKDAGITDTAIEGPGISLKLKPEVPIRQGNLLSTVFRPFTTITKLLPQKSLSLNESKWYGTSTLETKSASEPAVVIFEKVIW
jgi:hypothetical protein